MEEIFFTKQILTYMGNKRKFIDKIDEIITVVKNELGEKNINIAEGFSGSGIISRLLKNRVMGDNTRPIKNLYVNDTAGYSKTINQCYLTSTQDLCVGDMENLILHKKKLNDYINKNLSTSPNPKPFVAKYWAPQDDENIKEDERAYFTQENAIIIDKMMYYIMNYVEEKYKPYLLAPLLVQCSIHNNTNGQFSAFYKDENKEKGMYGGKKHIDLKRIKGKIKPLMPVLTSHKAKVHISQMDANDWIKNIPEVDLMYYDPPYNKHPYNIYYFLLDIINTWNTNLEIPDTYRGQPKNWIQSNYCSFSKALEAFEKLIENTKAKFILLSYNNKGIIALDHIDRILKKYGKLYKIPIEHNVYNKLIGIGAKKRQKKSEKIEEYLWLVDCRKKH